MSLLVLPLAIRLDPLSLFRLWRRRAVTRRHLSWLDARGLADIGLDEDARRRELAKWFWQE